MQVLLSDVSQGFMQLCGKVFAQEAKCLYYSRLMMLHCLQACCLLMLTAKSNASMLSDALVLASALWRPEVQWRPQY